jgi:uncharacterized repeat protein (TIGR03806 family)
MRRFSLFAFCVAGSLATLLCSLTAATPESKPVGIDRRVPWTTSRVKGSPEPPEPYRTEPAFARLKFDEPLDMAQMPGSNRLAVAQRRGKLFTFVNDPANASANPLLDLKQNVYSITCHPRFAENRYLFVLTIGPDGTPDGNRVHRFTVSRTDPPRADPGSDKVVFSYRSGGHNGGSLRFGPDGYLYIGAGDGSGIADDDYLSGQDISDVHASILRIDVDHPEAGKAYGVPKDNPFVATKGARPEVWAYGIRQPWRMSFDRATGDLWVGEVGQDLWESVLRIEKGGNYGWSITEGSHPFRPQRKRGPTPILKPVVEHPHSDFRSLTGGYVYRGKRLPDLVGAYLYGDFDTGRVWALRYDGGKVTYHKELCRTTHRIVGFGEDSSGEVYYLDFVGGRVHRLAPASPGNTSASFPRRLSETGLFISTKDHTPAPGLIPYTVNAALWSDGADKERFLALPGTGQIGFEEVIYPEGTPGAAAGWKFPDGAVVVKTFALEMQRGNRASRRRLETRLLHYQHMGGTEEYGDQYWRGYTYVWNDEQTDAFLADAAGLDRTFTIKDPVAPGGVRKQTWHFPSRAECTLCHTMSAKYVLGVNTLQMNREYDYGGGRVANQLHTLEHLGVFRKPLPKPPEEMAKLADYDDEHEPLDRRARAYLHANCSHCHRKWGGGNAEFQLLAYLDLKDTGTVNTRPGQGTFGLADPRVLVPGAPDRSLVLYRMKLLGLGRMPHVASSVVDEKGARLVEEWVRNLRP